MIDDAKTHAWEILKKQLAIGSTIQGTVVEHKPFGVFLDIGSNQFRGLIQIVDFKKSGVMTEAEYPAIGEKVLCTVLGYKEFGNQIWLGLESRQSRGQST